MKYSYFYLIIPTLLITSYLKAQISIDSSDLYTAPSIINIVKTNNAESLNLKSNGNQNWDFRSLKADSVQQIIIRKIDKNNPIDKKFTDASLVLERPGEGNAYLFLTKDSLTVDGIANFMLDENITADVDLKPNLKLIQLPLNYLDAFSTQAVVDSTKDTIIKIGPVPIADSIRVEAKLSQISTCDAYGTLKTVQATFNTIRLKTVEKQTTSIYIHQTSNNQWAKFQETVTQVNRYTWLSKDRGYQIAEVTTDSLDKTILTAQYILIDSLFGFIDSKTNPNCFGESNGSANFKTVIGSNNYAYKWSANAQNQTTEKATNLSAGTYTITVTDLTKNQTFFDTLTLTQPDSLSTNIDLAEDETSNQKDGKIELSVTGGTPPYSFSWDRSTSNTHIADNLETGTHEITVKDAKGCTKIVTAQLGPHVGFPSLNEQLISVFPNPTNGKLNLVGFNENIKISLVDVTGQLIVKKVISNEDVLDLTNFKSGIYFLTLETSNNITIHKIVRK